MRVCKDIRERETDKDRQTDRQKVRKTDRQTDRQTDKQTKFIEAASLQISCDNVLIMKPVKYLQLFHTANFYKKASYSQLLAKGVRKKNHWDVNPQTLTLFY